MARALKAWAYLRHMGSSIYIFLATDDPPKGNQVRIPLPRFKIIMDELGESVAEGNLDQRLSSIQGTFPTAVGLILEKFSPGSLQGCPCLEAWEELDDQET